MYLHVLALDVDGTVAENNHVADETWAALREAKEAGISIILVTGRQLEALKTLGPFEELCEAIVAENGGVVCFPESGIILRPFGYLAAPFLAQLQQAQIPLEVGEVIAATWVPHDTAVFDIISRSRYPATIEYNKGAVMILPPGATKGTGLLIALQELGYSPHNTVACGDGENDHSFFEQVEVSVAVANATPALKEQASIVLEKANGAGVRSLIKDLLKDKITVSGCRKDHELSIGRTSAGASLCINPLVLTKGNLMIAGSSGSGKSWLAGLLIERLLEREYQLCVIDSEGDYGSLQAFPQTLILGGSEAYPPPVAHVITLMEYTRLSLIIDLSLYSLEEKTTYLTSLLVGLKSLRSQRGKPHWLVIDEAHYFCSTSESPLTHLIVDEMQAGGIGVISYRPSLLAPAVIAAIDHWILTQVNDNEELAFLSQEMKINSTHPAALQIPDLTPGKAFVRFNPLDTQDVSPVIVEYKSHQRTTTHIRHLHKYLRAPLPANKQFYFKIDEAYQGPRTAASLWGFLEALPQLPLASLQYHLHHKHFEQWLTKVLYDKELARQLRKIDRREIEGEWLRKELISVTQKRYDELEKLI